MKKIDGPSLAPLSGKAKHLVILLHGYGANGEDLLSLGEEWAPELPDAAFAAPNAPEACGVFPVGYQWFPIRAIDPREFERERSVENVTPVLHGFIDDQLKKWGVAEDKVIVVGFSQGAMMAMYAMPRRENACAGVIGFSGMLIDAAGLKGAGIVKMPILAIHGEEDTVVPPESLAAIDEGFSAAGFDVETAMRPGLSHAIDQFGLIRGLDFIREKLGIPDEKGSKFAKV